VSEPTSLNEGPICAEPECTTGPQGTRFQAKSAQGLTMHLVRSHGRPGKSVQAQARARRKREDARA
jgi:hypothetical protein